MKTKIVIFMATLMAAILSFCSIPVHAANRKVNLIDIEATEKSDTTTVANFELVDNNISSNITFGKEGDFVLLSLKLQNATTEKLKIASINDNLSDDHLSIEYNSTNDWIEPGTETILGMKITYAKKVLNIDKVSFNNIEIALNLADFEGNITPEAVIINNNPSTLDNIWLHVGLFIIFTCGLVGAWRIYKRKKIIVVAILVVIATAMPLGIIATAKEADENTIHFTNIDIIGEFETYEITFNPDNNSDIVTIPVTYGDPIGTLPAAPRKDGYDFKEWQDESGAKIDENTVIERQISVTAKYTPTEYEIGYDLNDGSLTSPNPTSYNIETLTFSLKQPRKEHYIFIGWTGSNGEEPQLEPVIEQGSIGDKYFTANYIPVQYVVSFNPNGGSINDIDASRKVAYNTSVGELPVATRDDFGFDGWYTAAENGDKITQNTIITGSTEFFAHWADNSTLATNIIASKVNENGDYQIDYTKKAIISDRVDLANGNGVNVYKEGGEDIYYYRGEIYDNNVIWANKCWKILRTTKTGGTKLVYNGEPSEVNTNGETTLQCLSTGEDALIENVLDENATSRLVPYNGDNDSCNSSNCSIASIGYMYGVPSKIIHISSSKLTDSYKYYFSDGVTINGNEATLNTGTEHIYSGYWTDADFRNNVKEKHHYFCADNKAKCSLANLRWKYYSGEKTIYALALNQYHNPDDLIAAMQENISDSSAKKIVDAWYERNLADKANDLEDTVFCGEKDIVKGILFDHKDSNKYSYFSAMYRVSGNDGQMAAPSLDCNRKYSYTTSSANGNGKLKYKIGLISVDEAALAGEGRLDAAPQNFLTSGTRFWTMSPYGIISSTPYQISVGSDGSHNGRYVQNSSDSGLRPSVSLKAGTRFLSGDGTKENPYKTE